MDPFTQILRRHGKNTDTTGAVVLLEEEYGYRHWLWLTGLDAGELQRWWSELDSVEPYTLNPSKPSHGAVPLPGTLIELTDSPRNWKMSDLQRNADFSAHLNDDDDSFLKGEAYIFHRGYTGPDINIAQ